jgi:hypothetical protein
MAAWVLACGSCGRSFQHSKVDDKELESYFFPTKPDFPPGGSDLECPNCRKKATYQRNQLTYQS